MPHHRNVAMEYAVLKETAAARLPLEQKKANKLFVYQATQQPQGRLN
jgi:hypothetical protein